MPDWITTATTTDVARQAADIAVLPVGSFEQHGPHLPLITDTVIACVIAERIATDHGLRLLPPITVSCSHEHAAYPGTVSISASTLQTLINDIWRSLRQSGTKALILVNGHGGNYVLANVVQEANVDGPCMTLFPAPADVARARHEAGLESDPHADMHAGEQEVSILLHTAPDLVHADYKDGDHDGGVRAHLLVRGMTAYTETGVIGYPSLASAEKGAAILDSLSKAAAEHISLITTA